MEISLKKLLSNLAIIILLLIPFTTLFQGLFPFSINSVICGGFIVVLGVLFVLSSSKKITNVLLLFVFITSYVLTLILSEKSFMSANADGGFWWIMVGLTFTLIFDPFLRKDLYESFLRLYKLEYILLLIYVVSVILLTFSGSAYKDIYGWGGRYFIAYCATPHVMCSTAIAYFLVLTALITMKKIKKINIILALAFIYVILLSGARTFLGTIVLLLLFYIFLNYRFSFKQIMMLVIFSIVFVILLSNTPMMTKLATTNDAANSSDFLARFTSGRSIFWVEKLKAFNNYNFINKLFGGGYGSVNQIGLSYTNANIDAHNDFINVLIDLGIFGFAILLTILVTFFLKITKNIPILARVVFVLAYVFTAFMTKYLSFVSLLPSWFILCFINEYFKNKSNSSI